MSLALVADPEERVRREICLLLSSAGFECLSPGPEEAMGALRSRPRELRLAILQASLPGFRPLAEECRALAPDCLIVALADIDSKAVLNRAVVDGAIDDFLPLPFSPADFQGLLKLLKGRMR